MNDEARERFRRWREVRKQAPSERTMQEVDRLAQRLGVETDWQTEMTKDQMDGEFFVANEVDPAHIDRCRNAGRIGGKHSHGRSAHDAE